MRLLLDSHFVLWLAANPARISEDEAKILADTANTLIISAVSIWELHLKWSRLHKSGDHKLDVGPDVLLAFHLQTRSEFIALNIQHAAASLKYPIAHQDPFDQLLLVQAQELEIKLFTRDAQLLGHPLVVTAP